MVFNATFNSISVNRGGQFYWWRAPEDSTRSDNLYIGVVVVVIAE